MSGYKVLFLGGSIDGERRVVERFDPTYNIAVYDGPAHEDLSCCELPMRITDSIRHETYCLETFTTKEGVDFYLYRHKDYTSTDVIVALLAGYKGSGR